MDFTYELEQLRNGDRSTKLISRIIKNHKDKAEKMKKLYARYKTEDVPILKRTVEDPQEINNQVVNDFFSEIIDTKVGYFSGNAVSYVLEDEAGNNLLQDFIKKNRLADVDAETTKWAAICGYAARLVYIPEGKIEERVVNIPPWEAILIGENGIDEADYGIRYYTVEVGENKTEARVELYDRDKVYDYSGKSFDDLSDPKEQEHVFDLCPMFGIMNNEELQGDAEKVLTNIDAYDRTISDVNSEIEAFRGAYLAFLGVEPPEEDEEEPNTSKNLTFYFRSDGNGGQQDAKFITKNIQDGAVENHLNRLHKNIYRFSKTPDLGDENFAGSQTGPAMKYKILALENKCASFERKFASSVIRMFEILASSTQKLRGAFDPYAIEMHFTRNFPEDTEGEARTQSQLKGLVPDEFRFSKLTGVDNPKQMAMDYKAEQDAYAKQFKEADDEESEIDKKLEGAGVE